MRGSWWKLLPVMAVAITAACNDANRAITSPDGNRQRTLTPKFNTPVTGAAFSTVDESMDGTGHCLNGNPDVNCNIYDGKQYVWLNGGPSVAYVGDGDYFFAVLSPGGQPAPNDGGTSVANGELANLSDNFDTYHDRTFSVSGGAVTYTGPHDFDGNKIRLMPYEDTPNPGGVYILAICSLADGYPVNPSKCKYDAFKIREGGSTPEASAPTVTKDANGSYDNTFTWQIAKDVDKTRVEQVGGSATFSYTVTVTHDGGTASGWQIAGTISVFNGNSSSITGVDVTDQLSDGTVCSVTGGSGATVATGETTFAYTCTLSAAPTGTLDNTATATWPQQTVDGQSLAAGSANFLLSSISLTENKVDECVAVSDSYAGNLGNVCVGDANPTTFTYQRVISIPSFSCLSYDNTATFTTNTSGTTGSAGQTVTVCGPGRSGALTIGFWKGPNGNSLIQNYCAPAGKQSLAAYLSGLGGGSGPFADAAGKSCNALVTYVNGILGAASATDMNKMLKAQMLGTALDVYFSDPNKGYTSTATGKIKPPSNFFTQGAIGSFSMDTRSICPMVDNLSTGVATCQGGNPSTDAVLAGALPSWPMTVQAILDYAATTTSPFNAGIWYGGNRTLQEILKNVFDQINNQMAFAG